MKKYQKNQEICGAILIQEDSLKSLMKFLEKHFDEFEFFGKTKDGTKIQFVDLEELLNYPNSKDRFLTELRISSSKNDKSIEINFKEYVFFIKPKILQYDLSYDNESW